MDTNAPKRLLHGFDTIQCCYYLVAPANSGIDAARLEAQREALRQTGQADTSPIQLGGRDFLLSPSGSRSGYPFVLSDSDYRIEFGPRNNPPFFVTYRSEAIWRRSVPALHQEFLDWVAGLGYQPVKPETLTRVDFCFDFHLPLLDFDESSFLSLSSKDAQHRENGEIQTFTFGKGDVVLRVYNKVAEIEQQSQKVWLFDLWGQREDVWRVEWQVRKEVLRRFGISNFADLEARLKALLEYLATDHDTLRIRTKDSNPSRWPLHPLWIEIQRFIASMEVWGDSPPVDSSIVLNHRLAQMGISLLGYLKKIGAIRCVQTKRDEISIDDAIRALDMLLRQAHDPFTWKIDVEKRIKAIQLGEW